MKNMKKRLLSIFLAVSMVLGIFPGMTSPVRAENQGALVPVYNNEILSKIMNHVHRDVNAGIGTATASIGPLYDYVGGSNASYQYGINHIPKDYALFYNTAIRRREGTWYQEWNIKRNIGWLNNLSSETTMRLGADFHNEGKSAPYMTINGKGVIDSKNKSVERKYADISFDRGPIITGGNGNGKKSEITSPWVVLIDNVAPRVQGGHGSGDRIGLVMNENLRTANENGSAFEGMTIKIKVADNKSKKEIGEMTAKYDGFDGWRTLYFKIQGDMTNKEYQVTSITNVNFNYGHSKHDFDVYGILDANSHRIGFDTQNWEPIYEYHYNAPTKLTTLKEIADSPITDSAGNGLKIKPMDLTPYNIVIDNVAPKLTGIELTGNMITSISTLDRTEWPTDINRSSVFGGVGEQLNFSLKIDEKVNVRRKDHWKPGIMTLNLKNKDGSPVTLKMIDEKTITYEPLIIEEGMTSTDGRPIHPVSISGAYFQDGAQNYMYYDNIGDLTPRQQIYIDTSAPKVEASLITENENRKLTIQLDFSDDSPVGSGDIETSGLQGLDASIALLGTSSPIATFKYALSDSPDSPFQEGYTGKAIDKKWTGKDQIGGESETKWIDLPLYDNTRYLHLEFEGDEKTLTISDLSIKVGMKDWAGNETNEDFNLEGYTLDETPPVILLQSMKTIYDATSATVYSDVKVKDINKIMFWYKWDHDDEVEGTLFDSIANMNKKYINNEKVASRIDIRAQDEAKNQTTASYSVEVDLTKPIINYVVNSDITLPDSKPNVTVTGSVYGDKIAYTRVTLSPDYRKYVRIVKTGETINLFDFDGKWTLCSIQNRENGQEYFVATSQNTNIKSHYGPVTIEFESAYDTDLTPKTGGKVDGSDVTNGSYVKSKDVLTVNYAPLRMNLYNISQLIYTDANGDALNVEGGYADHILFNQSMAGSRISFDISNTSHPEWGMQDVDFDRSYIALEKQEKDKTMTQMVKSQLSNSSGQSFTIPSLDKDGNPFTSGLYRLKVCVVQKDGNIDWASNKGSVWFILDSPQPQNPGLWKYTHKINFKELFGYNLFNDITKIGEGSPFDSVGISFKDRGETERNDLYSIESIGVIDSSLIIGMDNTEAKFLERIVEEAEGMRVWNAKCSEWENLTFNKVLKTDIEGVKGKVYQEHVINKDSIVETLEGTPADGKIRVTLGSNTIRYQIKMKNGMLTPIYEFDINISDEAPTMGLSVVGEYSKLDDGQGPNKKINKADLQINNAFSNNGNIKTYFLSKNGEFKKNGEILGSYYDYEWDSENIFDYSMGNPDVDPDVDPDVNLENGADIITIMGTEYNGYQNYSEGVVGMNNKNNAHNIFVAVDDAGGISLLIPQFRDEAYATEDGINTFTRYRFEHDILTRSFLNGTNQNKFGSRAYYYLQHWSENLILSESTITFKGEGLPAEGITLPVENPPIPNAAGYMGGYIASWMSNKLLLELTSPTIDDSHGADTDVNRQFTLNAVGRAGDKWDYTGEMNTSINPMKYLDLLGTTSVYIDKDNPGVTLFFYTYVSVNGGGYNDRTTLPIFTNGSYSVKLQDSYGVAHDYDFEVDFPEFKIGPKISFSTMEPTTKPVTVTFSSEVNGDITVVGEGDKAIITGNGTTRVTALVSENSNLIVNWGDGESRTIPVRNIGTVNPKVVWSYQEEDIVDNQVTGPVTAMIVDDNWSLEDSATRELPEYIFYPGGETSHTFSVVNGEEGAEPIIITITLPVTLIDSPAIPNAETDTTAPSLQLLAYLSASAASGLADQKKSLRLHDFETQWKNPDLMNYSAYIIYNKSIDFLRDLGWGERYRFRVETGDQSTVKLIIKNGLYATNPTYTDNSDIVPGVTLAGNSLDVLRNTAFTLFAVDSAGNCTAVNMDIKNVGAAPIPKLVKTFPSISSARVYLMPATEGEVFTDLKLTNVDSKQEAEGTYAGKWYIDFTKNGTFTLRYSYNYQGKTTTGTLDFTITEIDNTELVHLNPTKWSANKNLGATNQDVIAQLEFNKTITKVTADKTAEIQVIVNGNRMSVRYKENCGPVTLTCTSANGKSIKVTLDKVDNIDKISPIISATEPSPTANGRSAIVSFRSDEDVTFQEGRKQGRDFDLTITKNGKYTYHFTDKAGNTTIENVEVDSLVLDPLKLQFSTSSDGSNSVKYPSDLKLEIGHMVYVSANRECDITFNNGGKKSYTSGWIGFTISEDTAGLYPSIHAVDGYGNSALGQLSQIALPDKKPPIISLKRNTLNAEFGTKEDDLKAILIENAIVFDAADKNPTIEVKFTMPDSPMVVPVTYTAMDKTGNKSEFKGYMRLTDGTEAEVSVNGELVERDGIFLADPGKLKLTVNLKTTEPYSVMYKNGIKTAGQMKIGVTDIVGNRTNANEIELPFDKEGYYTVSIVTQGREYFRFLIYIK